jgi:hypothetical protein
MCTRGFPRNLGSLDVHRMRNAVGDTATRITPARGRWRSAPLGANRERATEPWGDEKPRGKGMKNSEHPIVVMKQGNRPEGTLRSEGDAGIWNRWGERWRERRISEPSQQNNNG